MATLRIDCASCKFTFYLIGMLTLLTLSGCSLVTIDFPGTPLPPDAVKIRNVTRDFARQFAQSVESTADTIAAETSDKTIQQRTLMWKSNAVSALQRAVFQSVPTIAILDTWVLCAQMTDFLKEGEGRRLFDQWQPIAIAAAQALEQDITVAAESVASGQDFRRWQRFVAEVALSDPIKDLSFQRHSVMMGWLDAQGEKEKKKLSITGNTPDLLGDLMDRVTFYEQTIPRQARWQTELFISESEIDSKLRRQLNVVTTQSAELIHQTNIAVNRLSHLEEQQSQLAAESPELIDAAILKLSTELDPVMQRFNQHWDIMMDRIMLERKAVVESFQAERSAIIQVLREERVRIIEEADRLSMTLLDKLWTMAKSLATKIGIFMTINILLILGLPFVMGIMVGKAMGLKSATKTKTSQDPL